MWQATDNAVGEEDPACERDPFSCGLGGGPGRHPDNEGRGTPYGGKHSTHYMIVHRDSKQHCY